jgi:hypothetical protein
MSGGGGGGNSTQTTDLPGWAQPYAIQYMQNAQNLGSQTYQPYTGQRFTGQNDMQRSAIQQTARQAQGGSSVNNAASNNLTSTLNGDYLSQGNPYLTANIDRTSQDVIRNYNLAVRPQTDAMDARSGSFGNSGVAQTQQEQQRQLGETLAGVSSSMRGQDYANERNRQLSAAGMAPGAAQASYNDSQQLYNAGTLQNAPQQQNLDFQYQQHQEQQNDPYRRLTAQGAPFGANLGSVVNSQGPSGNSTAQWLGGGLAAGSALGSLYGNSGSGGGK